MHRFLRPLWRFWSAEEVPRWFGFALVGVFVASLGGVALLTTNQDRHHGWIDQKRHIAHSVRMLAELIAQDSDPDAWEKFLLDYANAYPCRMLRLIDQDGNILSSIDAGEIGRTVTVAQREILESNPLQGTEAHDKSQHPEFQEWTFAAAVPRSRHAGEEDASAAQVPVGGSDSMDQADESNRRYVVAMLVPTGGDTFASRIHTVSWFVILGAVIVFWALYRRLRVHMASVSKVTESLLSLNLELGRGPSSDSGSEVGSVSAEDEKVVPGRRERLPGPLDCYAVADSLGPIGLAWNELLELTESLRQASLRTQASEELYRVLEAHAAKGELTEVFDLLPDGVLVLNEGAVVSYVNRFAALLLGWDPDAPGETRSNRISELTTSPAGQDIVSGILGAIAGPGGIGPNSGTTQVITDQHSSSSYRLRVLPLTGLTRSHGDCVVIISDVSQQVRADRAREEFVSQVTHELRTPLTNIRAYTETLSSGMFDDPAVVAECYNVITKETRRLSRLIEDILSVSQLEVGSLELVIDDVDVRNLLTESVRDLRGLADEKGLDLQVVLPSKIPPFRGDRDKLLVVMTNLLGNAIKYTPRGGRVQVSCRAEGPELAIVVADSGIGIDMSEHERIFEKFQRSRDEAVQNETGTGIGLTTAREIVHRHGGSIELESAKGQGSTFTVRLPLAGAPRGVNCDLAGLARRGGAAAPKA